MERGFHPPQLSATPIALVGKIPFGCQGRFWAAWHPTHVDVKDLIVVLILMSGGATVLPKDLVESLLHLAHILISASIQRLLHYRLFCTSLPPEGGLQSWICSQPGIDFYHAVSSC